MRTEESKTLSIRTTVNRLTAMTLSLLGVFLLLGSLSGTAWGTTKKVMPLPRVDPEKLRARETIKPIEDAFNQAMGAPLHERIGLLGALEQRIDSHVFSGQLSGHAKTLGLYYKFHTQLQQAKYREFCQTYADYIKNIKAVENVPAAKAAFLRNLTDWQRRQDYAFCASVCETMAEELAGESDLAATAVYYEAYCKFRLNGTMNQCVALCAKLIADYPESSYKPLAMRMLANAYMAQGNPDSALNTLALLKRQYPNTQWEHYADMRPAIVWEKGRGDPQKALAIYTDSLARYPDHMYGPYIQKQIQRLRKVIEEQLIMDALEGVVKNEDSGCHLKSVIVKSDSQDSEQMAARF